MSAQRKIKVSKSAGSTTYVLTKPAPTTFNDPIWSEWMHDPSESIIVNKAVGGFAIDAQRYLRGLDPWPATNTKEFLQRALSAWRSGASAAVTPTMRLPGSVTFTDEQWTGIRADNPTATIVHGDNVFHAPDVPYATTGDDDDDDSDDNA